MNGNEDTREERRQQIADIIGKDADLTKSLSAVLMPEIADKPLQHISATERNSLARRLNLVVEAVINIEGIENRQYDDNKLTGALLLTAEKARKARDQIDQGSTASKHEYMM